MAPCNKGTNQMDFLTEEMEAFDLSGGTNESLSLATSNCSRWYGTSDDHQMVLLGNCSLSETGPSDEIPIKLNKFQIIKAVVLAGVTVVIMISVCRMVFQLFVRYNVRQDR